MVRHSQGPRVGGWIAVCIIILFIALLIAIYAKYDINVFDAIFDWIDSTGRS